LKKLLVILFALLQLFVFTGCGEYKDISGAIHDIYIVYDEDITQLVKTADDEYLYAFYGRKEGEPEDKNRVIYLNKDNQIEKEFYLDKIPENVNLYLTDFHFDQDYLMLVNRQYSGVTADGTVHGVIIVDSEGNIIRSYKNRDPYNFAGVDMFTRFNRFTFNWCEKDKDTFIITTYLSIYECNMKDGSFTKILSLEDIVKGFSAQENLTGRNHLELFSINYGFGRVSWSDKQGLIFAVCDSFDNNGACTVYAMKDGTITRLTEKDACGTGRYRPYYNARSDSLVRLDEKTATYMVNEQPYPEYTTFVQMYYYFDPERPVLLGTEYTDTETRVAYFDSTSGKHYSAVISGADATVKRQFHNEVWSACGNYIYLTTVNSDYCYRHNVETGKGEFVISPLEDKILMPGYRIRQDREVTTENTLTYRLQIYKEKTI